MLALFALGHERSSLDSIADLPHIRKVYLPDLSPDNRLAEARIFQSDLLLDCQAEYIGLCAASWNIKYGGQPWRGRVWSPCMPIERLEELPLAPNEVWAAATTASGWFDLLTQGDQSDSVWWSEDLDQTFNGIHQIVLEIIEVFGLKHHYRDGVLANNFIAHSAVAKAHCRFMRDCISYLDSKYGIAWPIQPDPGKCFTDRLPAFACEAASILYFANRTDLTLRKIPT